MIRQKHKDSGEIAQNTKHCLVETQAIYTIYPPCPDDSFNNIAVLSMDAMTCAFAVHACQLHAYVEEE